jgi:hypothetical protein
MLSHVQVTDHIQVTTVTSQAVVWPDYVTAVTALSAPVPGMDTVKREYDYSLNSMQVMYVCALCP